MTRVHFWTKRQVEDLSSWDPDREPNLYASGYGHSFLELYARLRDAGSPTVSIGAVIASGTDVVVVSLEELSDWRRHGWPRMNLALCRAIGWRRPALVVVRVDVHLHIRVPLMTTREVMPTLSSAERDRQRFVPLLPQRGLIQRDKARGQTCDVVGLKLFSQNMPSWLSQLSGHLTNDGVRMRIDTEASEHSWGDFKEVDIALCTQVAAANSDPRRKPPTKLINAWAAGVSGLIARLDRALPS